MTEYSLRDKLITEYIGTFFLTLTICLVGVFKSGSSELAPFAIASTLMVMIYAGGHVSGAHYNPAVTISIYLRGACEKSAIAPYILTQVAAAVSAAMIASHVFAPSDSSVGELEMEAFPALAAELIFTFALAYVILNVATSETTEGNGYYGAAIASVVLAGALTVGSISGASFNPAVSVSLIVTGSLGVGDSWLHFLPQIAGGILAAYVIKAQHN